MRTDTTSRRRTFGVDRLVACAVAAALAAPLPSCGFRRDFAYGFYKARAIVRTAGGVEVVVLSDGDPLFNDRMFRMVSAEDLPAAQAPMALRFKKALQRRLTEAAADPAIRARFGDGAACIVEEPLIEWAPGGTDTPDVEEAGPEIPTCTDPAPPPPCEAGGGTPVLGVSPPELAFGTVPLGTIPTLTVTVSNDGDGFLCLASIVQSGAHPRDYQIDDTDCRPTDPDMARRFLGPGASCTVLVTFNPEEPGTRNATLRVSGSVEPVLREFPMTAESQPGSLTPRTPICIPRAPAPDTCFHGSFTLTNPGPGAVQLHAIGIVVPWEPDTTCGPPMRVIPPGGSDTCTIHICSDPPPEGRAIVVTSGVVDDPAHEVFEIPIHGRESCP